MYKRAKEDSMEDVLNTSRKEGVNLKIFYT